LPGGYPPVIVPRAVGRCVGFSPIPVVRRLFFLSLDAFFPKKDHRDLGASFVCDYDPGVVLGFDGHTIYPLRVTSPPSLYPVFSSL